MYVFFIIVGTLLKIYRLLNLLVKLCMTTRTALQHTIICRQRVCEKEPILKIYNTVVFIWVRKSKSSSLTKTKK
jgi:hypothetical protein